MKIAVCDDSTEQLEQIWKMILAWPDRPGDLTVSVFNNASSLLLAHSAAPFDIIFLDVLMPQLNGIDTARKLRQTDSTAKLVFLTTSPEYAVDAFTVKASNYLLKPLDPEKLNLCLNDLSQEFHASARRILVKSLHALHRIPVADIEYIESQNKQILFVLSDGQTIRSGEPLYMYEEKLTLEEGFFKCSRSFIVNIHKIDTFSTKEIRTRSGARIPISRSCQKEFERAYFSVLFGKAGDDL